MVKNDSYYRRLGVEPTATKDEITKAYRIAIFKTHPDLFPDDPTAEDKAKKIIAAGSVLTDSKLRAQYDLFGPPDDSLDRAVNRAWRQNSTYTDTAHQTYSDNVYQNWEPNSAFGAAVKGYQRGLGDFGDIRPRPNGRLDRGTKACAVTLAVTALSAMAAYNSGLDSEPFSWFLSEGDQLAYTDWFSRSPDSARAVAAKTGGTIGFLFSLGATGIAMQAEGIYKGIKSALDYLRQKKSVRIE